MPGIDCLVLRFGLSSWLRKIHFSSAVLASVAILLAPTNIGWKFGSLSVLVFVALIAHAAAMRKNNSGLIRLLQDGTAHVRTTDGKQSVFQFKKNAWALRWLCVMPLTELDGNRHLYCVVCASENRPDEYRHLLRFLRMRTSEIGVQKAAWW